MSLFFFFFVDWIVSVWLLRKFWRKVRENLTVVVITGAAAGTLSY